jgi:hypothetical protein
MTMPQINRYPPGKDLLGFDTGPAGVVPETVVLTAQDQGRSKGVLYARGSERTAVCVLHPRGDMSRHYLIPYLVEAGYAAFGQESRWPGNDIAATHEVLLIDIAAAMRFLRERGYRHIVCLGYSAGGSVYSFYQAQAVTQPPGRLTDTAAGDPNDLNRFDMPPADGLMFISAHLGAGKSVMTEIDPSVIDENDPLSCDPSLDMYNPANGFREPPEHSKYADGFIERYRAAQIARVARIDAIARQRVAEQRFFRDLAGRPEFDRLPAAERAAIGRRAMAGTIMQIHRTTANPAMTDLSLHPSSRGYGSLMSVRPDLANYGEAGFAKALTPRAWLSLWSGLSSRASVLDNLPKITVPTLVVNFTGDAGIYPFAAQAVFDQCPAKDKTLARVDGDHFGFPLPSKPNGGGRGEAGKVVAGWLRERFPAR